MPFATAGEESTLLPVSYRQRSVASACASAASGCGDIAATTTSSPTTPANNMRFMNLLIPHIYLVVSLDCD